MIGAILLMLTVVAGAAPIGAAADSANAKSEDLHNPTGCVELDRDGVALKGKIHIDTVFGPPNWGDSPKTDKKIKVLILHLNSQITVCGDDSSSNRGVLKYVSSLSVWSNSIAIKPGEGVFTGMIESADTVSQITEYIFTVKSAKYTIKTRLSRPKRF